MSEYDHEIAVKSGPRDRLENLGVCRDSRYRGPVAEADPDAPVPLTVAEQLEAALAEPEAGS